MEIKQLKPSELKPYEKINRWQAFTGRKAIREDGVEFDSL